jgi:hypothetical protein
MPEAIRNSERLTLNQVRNAAPLARRHIEQWQLVWSNGVPLIS